MSKSVNVAMVGLGFGAEFIPIYQAHPQANVAAICQRNKEKMDAVGNRFGIEKRYTNYADVLKDRRSTSSTSTRRFRTMRRCRSRP
jgi:predicted dehydrogenase